MLSLPSLKLPVSYSNQDRSFFYKQLAVLLSSGITLLQALKLLGNGSQPTLGPVCQLLSYSLQQGQTLAAAMSLQKEFFPPLAITLTLAGEKSGQLIPLLEEIADYYDQLEELRSFIVKTALYPALLLLTAGGVLGFFMLYVLPIIANTISSLQSQPSPFLINTVLFKSFLERHYPVLLMVFMLVSAFGYKQRDFLLHQLLRLPFLSAPAGTLQEIRFCRLMSLLLNSGLPLTEALELTARTLENREQQARLFYFNQKLAQGMDPVTAARLFPALFSPVTLELLTVGAAAGTLPRMLGEAGNIQEQRLRRQLTRIKELLGPSLLLVAALLTAAVICSALEPLFNLFTAIPEY